MNGKEFMLDLVTLQPILRLALIEDIGAGDITSELLIPPGRQAFMQLVARERLTVAGIEAAALVFDMVDRDCYIRLRSADGAEVEAGTVLLDVRGEARSLLAAERTALNVLQRACGVASLTRQFVRAVEGTGAQILDTRKTMPGLRMLDKHAVTCGGGVNHRMGLYDAVMVKDNHIALGGVDGSIAELVERARRGLKVVDVDGVVPVIVECDTLAQVREAVAALPNRILLDNMSLENLREAVRLVGGVLPLEASGGVTLANARAVAETGVDFISIGALTHSAKAADIGADVGAE